MCVASKLLASPCAPALATMHFAKPAPSFPHPLQRFARFLRLLPCLEIVCGAFGTHVCLELNCARLKSRTQSWSTPSTPPCQPSLGAHMLDSLPPHFQLSPTTQHCRSTLHSPVCAGQHPLHVHSTLFLRVRVVKCPIQLVLRGRISGAVPARVGPAAASKLFAPMRPRSQQCAVPPPFDRKERSFCARAPKRVGTVNYNKTKVPVWSVGALQLL